MMENAPRRKNFGVCCARAHARTLHYTHTGAVGLPKEAEKKEVARDVPRRANFAPVKEPEAVHRGSIGGP